MSKEFPALLETAAELRAAGHSWSAIAEQVQRDAKTCRAWPHTQRALWAPIYERAQARQAAPAGGHERPPPESAPLARPSLSTAPVPTRRGDQRHDAELESAIRAYMHRSLAEGHMRRARLGLPPLSDEQLAGELHRKHTLLRQLRELADDAGTPWPLPAARLEPVKHPAPPLSQPQAAAPPPRTSKAFAGPNYVTLAVVAVCAALAGNSWQRDPAPIVIHAAADSVRAAPGIQLVANSNPRLSNPPYSGYPERVPIAAHGARMAAPMAAYLVAKRDDGFGDVHPLHKGTTYGVGRSPKNRIALPDDLCSRDHAEVTYAEDSWYVRDLDSLNGTRVNGKGVRGDRKLDSGDEVQFGRTKFLFIFDLTELPGLPESPSRALEEAVKITRKTGKSKFLPERRDSEETVGMEEAESGRAIATLYRLALDMGSARSLESLAEAVLAGLFAGLPVENGAVLAVKAGRDLEMLAHRSRDGKVRTFHKSSQLVSSAVLDGKEAILADNVLNDPQYNTRDSIRDLRAGSLICVPVIDDDYVIGLIHLYSSSQISFTDDDLDYAVAVGRQMSGAWVQLRRQDQLTNTNRELKALFALESELVGSSQVLKQIEGQIGRVAGTSATVLIRGESGSGKELVARAIHNNSPRREGPFVTLNCAAITESLLESELFGHERGAYTGATEKMIGKFEAADRGTIFLDEIGEMPLSTQSKFLRVLEGHPFERLGGNNQIKVDVRVVAATNRPLEQAVRDNNFRKDLFYRLQVVEIRVPPLRERLDDVPVLAEHFLKKFTRETGRRIKGFTPEAMAKLQAYAWPGNVRELRNAIERAVALNDKALLEPSDVWLTPLDQTSSGQHMAIVYRPLSLEDVEKRHIKETLKFTDWNKSRAAEILGIERSTLDRKIKAYNLSRD